MNINAIKNEDFSRIEGSWSKYNGKKIYFLVKMI